MWTPRPILRAISAFANGPVSVRHAIRVIVVATVVTTLAGALLVWVVDPDSFASFGDALWWSLQTVTTVGYGDVTPRNGVGRVVAGLILMYAVAFLAVLTAAITSTFIERARRDRHPDDEPTIRDVVARLDQIMVRLDRLEHDDDAAS